MRTRLFTAGLAVLALAVAPGSAAAQEAQQSETVPDVAAAMSGKGVVMTGAESLKAGPTRFTFSVTDRAAYRYGILYRIRPGKSPAHIRSALKRRTPRRFFSSVETVVASTTIGRRETRALSVTLQPSTTYAAIEATPRSHRRWRATFITTSPETSTATLPTPAGVVAVGDGRMSGPAVLPRQGVMRFDTTGKQMHSVTAFRLKRGATNARVNAALRRSNLARFQRLTMGRPVPVLGLMNAGTVDAELAFPRPGRYVLVCMHKTGSKAHHRRGERLIVTVQ